MNITPVQDDKEIWKKKINNPEVVELIEKMRTWENGKTFEVALQNPVKSLPAILKRELKPTHKVSAQNKDEIKQTWYIKIDPRKKASQN
jgi:hypothetical protein